MKMYRFTEYELFHENTHDTKLMVSWNPSLIMVCFRGTYSLKNLIADLKVSRIIHPPVRGTYLSRPKVHRGFLRAWTSNGLDKRVLECIQNILKTNK